MPITTNTQALSKIDQAIFLGKKKLKKKKSCFHGLHTQTTSSVIEQ